MQKFSNIFWCWLNCVIICVTSTYLAINQEEVNAQEPQLNKHDADEEIILGNDVLSNWNRAEQLFNVGEPEFALRLIAHETGPEIINQRRLWYRQGLELRLEQNNEGAVVEMLLHPPAGAEGEREFAAVQLGKLWRQDKQPTIRSLNRRLAWYDKIQHAIRPAPLSSDLPVILVLLTMDELSMLDEPEIILALLSQAERISPNNPLWAGYAFTNIQLLDAAESLVSKEKYLAALEVYRQLIYRESDKAAWFQRKYVHAQLDRLMARARIAGADIALQDAGNLRKEFFSPTELAGYRIYEKDLMDTVANYQLARNLPHTVMGNLELEALPVTYLIADEIYVNENASLTLSQGAMIQSGKLILEGGMVHFRGTPENPVRVFGVTFTSDPEHDGGLVTGEYVHFRNCRWVNPQGETVPWATQWKLDKSYSIRCDWRFDQDTRLSWSGSVFEDCQLTYNYTDAVPDTADESKSDTIEPLQIAQAEDIGYFGCRFVDSLVDDVVGVSSTSCAFVDCALDKWSSKPHVVTTNTYVEGNYYEPAGQLPYLINQNIDFATGFGPYIFMNAPSDPVIQFGMTDRWVE